MRKHLFAMAVVLAFFVPMIAYAACGDLVVDELGAISNKAAVVVAAQRLSEAGVEVRVRAFKSRRGAINIDEFEQKYRAECPEWLVGGRLRSNVFLFLYVDNKSSQPWVGIFYGNGLARLDSHYRQILADRFIPRVRDFRSGDTTALTPAFVAVLGDARDVLDRPVGPAPTIVHKNPVNYSWALITLGVLGVVVFVILVFARQSTNRSESSSAQAEASRVRSQCIDRVQRVVQFKSSQKDRLEKAHGVLSVSELKSVERYLGTINELGERAFAAFMRFDSVDGQDPNKQTLSVSAYRSNQERYEEIVAEHVEPAERLMEKVIAALERVA